MIEIVANVEVCILLAIFCILGITSFVLMIMSKVREVRKDKEETGAWSDFFKLRNEVDDLKRQVDKLQSR